MQTTKVKHMLVTVGNTKGGCGKSTLAVNLTIGLALAGQDVLLIDGDPQGHALLFTEMRSEMGAEMPGYDILGLTGIGIRTEVRKAKAKRDHTVIDVGGRDSESLRAALTVSDLVLVPVVPRTTDMWGTESMAELVREAKTANPGLRALAFLNIADPSGQDNEAATAALSQMDGLEVSPVRIVRRKAVPNAWARGQGITEYRGDGADKASEEFRSLFNSIYQPTERKKATK
jgi:chromosome partitioning protein